MNPFDYDFQDCKSNSDAMSCEFVTEPQLLQSSFGDAAYNSNDNGIRLDQTESFLALKQVRKSRVNSGKGRHLKKVVSSS